MFLEESTAIRSVLATPLVFNETRTVLSLASGNQAMREIHQPFIQANVFSPLEQKGIRCIHHELLPDEGVDIAGDLYSDAVRRRLKETSPDIVLCLNLLEHIPKREEIAAFVSDLIRPGGFLLVTVPRSYQYHGDPIDTYFRPTPHQLTKLFPSMVTIKEETIHVGTLLDEFRCGGGIGTVLYRLARHCWRCIAYLSEGKKWLSHVHSTLWLFKQREVSLICIRKLS